MTPSAAPQRDSTPPPPVVQAPMTPASGATSPRTGADRPGGEDRADFVVPWRRSRPRRPPSRSYLMPRVRGLKVRTRGLPYEREALAQWGSPVVGGCAYCTRAPPTCSIPEPPPVAPRPRAVHAEHHRSIDERPRPLGLRRASDLRSARPASVSDVVTPESSSSHEQHMMLRCRKAEGPADLHDRRGLPVMRCSDRCGPQRLVASRSRISVSSSTSVTSLASSAAFRLARRSLSLFIGRTMAK